MNIWSNLKLNLAKHEENKYEKLLSSNSESPSNSNSSSNNEQPYEAFQRIQDHIKKSKAKAKGINYMKFLIVIIFLKLIIHQIYTLFRKRSTEF